MDGFGHENGQAQGGSGMGNLRIVFAIAFFSFSVLIESRSMGAQPDSVPNEYLIHWNVNKAGSTFTQAEKLKSWLVGHPSGIALRADALEDQTFLLLRLNDEESSDSKRLIQEISQDAAVDSIEPNYLYYALENDSSPDDPMLSQLWGMRAMELPGVWNEGIRGYVGVRIGVIDTGIQWDHPDLSTQLFTNPGESGPLAANGIDDDGNGFVDDEHGWNFVNHSRDSRDDNGHGTHVAGTIAASGNNGIGVAGVNWNASVVPIKFLSSSGSGSSSEAINAIEYATRIGCRVLNNSWGGGPRSNALQAKIQDAGMRGILFVAAAGNDHRNNDGWFPAYPASYPQQNVIAVAATTENGSLASFSNYGANKVHVAAPGERILSTYMGGGYRELSGTSMATPHVTGLAAMLYAIRPEITPQEAIQRLIDSSTPQEALRGKVRSGGLVNAARAVAGL